MKNLRRRQINKNLDHIHKAGYILGAFVFDTGWTIGNEQLTYYGLGMLAGNASLQITRAICNSIYKRLGD